MRLSFALGLAVALGATPYGHHAFSAYYFEDRTVSIEGEVVAFEYVNPHTWLHVLARDNDGQMRKVGAEWSNPRRLGQQGVAKDTLKPGDRVIVTGSPSRDPSSYKMHLKRVERPSDGWRWGN
jgi:hypothetical protein